MEMGNRSLIIIRSEKFPTNTEIRLYGHWAGDENYHSVKRVVDRSDRIGDPDYLTAQLFHEYAVASGAYDGDLGYGISVAEQGSDEGWIDNPSVYVNADFGYYEYEGETYKPESRAVEPSVNKNKSEPEIVYEIEV
jgi:hypothetical protein